MTALYPKFKEKLAKGEINLTSDTIKISLVKNTYTYNSADEFIDDIGGSNLAGGTAAALTVAGITVADGVVDSSDDVETFLSINDGTVNAYVLWKDTGTESTSPVIGYFDSSDEFPKTTNGGDVKVTKNASGYFKL